MEPQQILSLAIEKEAEACALYADAAALAEDPGARKLLSELAAEEVRHKELLEGLPADKVREFRPPRAHDMMIAQYLEGKPLAPDSRLQDAMVFAMKREEQSRRFYEAMAPAVQSGELADLLFKLAAMEAAHKARLEALYEDVFLREG